MADSVTCQRCGEAVLPESTQGLCPACLLEQGLRQSNAGAAAGGPAAHAGAELFELARLFPQLEVLELIGRGGMGVVYKARHRGLDRLVALKLLPTGVDQDPGFQERFVREARALARLTHPNIVAVYDFGQVEGRYYFLMEFVDGANLRSMLQAGNLTPAQAMAIVPQLCDALQFAHEEGIVHRDIKPENILVDRKGRVKIADFGLAKLLGGSLPQDPYSLTGSRQVVGTPHYMAPEQFERPGTVDHRADIYSMGVVFYEMLTGELPLGRFPPPSRKVQVDVRLDEVVLRTLEKEPEQRYQRAGEVKTELAWMSSHPGHQPPPPPQSRGRAGGGLPHGDSPEGRARVSPYAVAGFLGAFPFPVALVGFAILNSLDEGPSPAPAAIAFVMIMSVVGVVCAVGSCALGLAGIRQIRNSAGRYYGLKLALADVLLYPIFLLDLALMALDGPMESPRLTLLILIAIAGLDVFLVRRAWRWVSRPQPPRPPAPAASAPPARPAQPPAQYALPPRRKFGCLMTLGAFVLAIFILYLGVGVPIILSRRAVPATLAMGEGVIRADVNSDTTSADGARKYRFDITSPADCKTVVWAEVWRNGKLEHNPGFDATQWVIPARGRGFNGHVAFTLAPEGNEGFAYTGKIKAGWEIDGNAGSLVSSQLIDDPFANMSVRDSTWGRWSGAWDVRPGRAAPLLVLRGAKDRLAGPAVDDPREGAADVEIRVFARFDRLEPSEQRDRPVFGASARPPGPIAPETRPATQSAPPDGSAPDAEPPVGRGAAGEGLGR